MITSTPMTRPLPELLAGCTIALPAATVVEALPGWTRGGRDQQDDLPGQQGQGREAADERDDGERGPPRSPSRASAGTPGARERAAVRRVPDLEPQQAHPERGPAAARPQQHEVAEVDEGGQDAGQERDQQEPTVRVALQRAVELVTSVARSTLPRDIELVNAEITDPTIPGAARR